MARGIAPPWKALREPGPPWHIDDDSYPDRPFSSDRMPMTVFSLPRLDWHRGSHLLPIALAAMLATGAIALVAYLLWPTWGAGGSRGPERMPVSIGGTLFNVP